MTKRGATADLDHPCKRRRDNTIRVTVRVMNLLDQETTQTVNPDGDLSELFPKPQLLVMGRNGRWKRFNLGETIAGNGIDDGAIVHVTPEHIMLDMCRFDPSQLTIPSDELCRETARLRRMMDNASATIADIERELIKYRLADSRDGILDKAIEHLRRYSTYDGAHDIQSILSRLEACSPKDLSKRADLKEKLWGDKDKQDRIRFNAKKRIEFIQAIPGNIHVLSADVMEYIFEWYDKMIFPYATDRTAPWRVCKFFNAVWRNRSVEARVAKLYRGLIENDKCLFSRTCKVWMQLPYIDMPRDLVVVSKDIVIGAGIILLRNSPIIDGLQWSTVTWTNGLTIKYADETFFVMLDDVPLSLSGNDHLLRWMRIKKVPKCAEYHPINASTVVVVTDEGDFCLHRDKEIKMIAEKVLPMEEKHSIAMCHLGAKVYISYYVDRTITVYAIDVAQMKISRSATFELPGSPFVDIPTHRMSIVSCGILLITLRSVCGVAAFIDTRQKQLTLMGKRPWTPFFENNLFALQDFFYGLRDTQAYPHGRKIERYI